MASRRVALISSGLSVVAAIGVGAWQTLSPCVYRGVRSVPANSGVPVGREFCAGSLVDVNGTGVLIVLSIPFVLALAGFLSVRAGKRGPAWVAVGLLFVLCVLGAASLGIFYLPAALLLAVGAFFSGSSPSSRGI